MSSHEVTTDFSAYLLSQTGVVNIELPNGQPMLFQGQPVRVHVHAPTSAKFTEASDARQRFIASHVQVKKGVIKNDVDPEQGREQDVQFLVAVTAAVENFPYPGGVAAMYRERGLSYIADQVRAYLNDQSNFFPSSAAA